MAPIPQIELPERLWRDNATLYLRLRQHGITATTIGCLIATHAIVERAPLWSLDGIFKTIANHSSLKLFTP